MATVIKTPPNNEEAEQSVLGAILIDKNSIGLIANDLFPDDFYSDTNAKIYQAMLELYEAGKPIDLLTLTKRLKKNKATEIEASYLTDLVNTVPTAANIEHYADIIKEDSTKRKLISLGTKMTDMGFSEEIGADELLDKAESYIFSISKGYSMEGFVPVKESLAARPGQGKTAMVVNIAQNIAVNDKKPVGIFSLEMSQEELVDRLLIGQADVEAWRLKTGRLSETDFAKLSEAMGKLADAPIFIDDTPGISVSQIRTKARRLQLEKNIELLIVDYLQLVDPGKRYDNRVQEVSLVSQSLKNLARELKIPVLAVSQLSRAVEHRGSRIPQLADLRE